MKITVLAENTSCSPQIGCEHGLSLFIETSGLRVLFDMGQTELFAENAAVLGVDLTSVDVAVLSHGHYDHGGGLRRFLRINSKAPVYLSRYAFEPHYNGTEKYIGLDIGLKSSERLVFTDGETKIAPNMTLYSCNEKSRPYGFDPGTLKTLVDGQLLPDDFRHEQYLLIEEAQKRVLISGCSHKGILNIAEWFRPDVLVGGFHFMKLELGDELAGYARRLNDFPTEYYTCHCTGAAQYEFMEPLTKRLHRISAGQTISIL